MTTPTLFNAGPADGNLTDRQQAVLELARSAGGDGIRAQDAGTALHALRGCRWCDRGQCDYLVSDGRSVLKALKDKRLVTQHRGGLWRAAGTTAAAKTTGYDPDTAEIPF